MSQRLAEIADFNRLTPGQRALADFTAPELEGFLDTASAEALGYLGRYTMPLVVWGDDIRGHVCRMAYWYALSRRGFNPEAASDIAVRLGYTDAVKWLTQVRQGLVNPVGVTDSAPAPEGVT